MKRQRFLVDAEVKAPDGSRRPVKFDILAESEREARSRAVKVAGRIGGGLVRGGFSVRQAATGAAGGDWT